MNVSAIITCRDTPAKLLAEALESLRVTRAASEIIVVDDCSGRPDTQTELQRQSELGAKVLTHVRRRQQPAARMAGVEHARGDYVLYMDSDDTVSGAVRGLLAPVNLASNNTPGVFPSTMWGYIEAPVPMQWGAIVRRDLARYLHANTEAREEDIAWGYRLMLAAWRDGFPIRRDSGLRYTWRAPEDRVTETSLCDRSASEIGTLRVRHLEHAFEHLSLHEHDRQAVRLWRDRRAFAGPHMGPHVESLYRRGARVDVHVLSYSRKAEWLRECLDSLRSEVIANIHVVVGGFEGSIGAARAFAFTLGDAEYVSFVDDDDIVVPGVLERLVDVLDRLPGHVGAYTNLEHAHPNGTVTEELKEPWNPVRQILRAPEITHLKAMRRSAVEPYLAELATYPTFEEYFLVGAMVERGRWVHIPVTGARKRATPVTESSMRLATTKIWNRAVRRVTPVLMAAAKSAPEAHAALRGSSGGSSKGSQSLRRSSKRDARNSRTTS